MKVPGYSQRHSKAECLSAWNARRRIPVPGKSGKIMDMMIIHLVEATAIDGVPVDLVIDARVSKRTHGKRFVVVFSDDRPAEDYPLPCLWVREGTGVWLSN